MPYSKIERRKAIADKGLDAIRDFGDLNFAITLTLLKAWNTLPKYATIHMLRKELVIEPKKSVFLQNLRTELADRFDTGDIYAAAAEAFHEFRNRIGTPYEALKCRINGDVEGYPEALAPILKELGQEIKKEVTSGLILPGESK